MRAARRAGHLVGAAMMLAALGAGSALTMAMEVAGIKLPEKIALGKGGPPLILNGAGVRHKFMTVQVYVGALYLSARKERAADVLSDAGPKRVSMHVLIEELTAKELIASLNDAIAANHIPAEIALIENRLRELNRMMSSIGVLKRGGVIYIDFMPGKGTRITVNGDEKLLIPGDDFYTALLRIWIGPKPVDGRLRDAMLGGGTGFKLF